MALTQGVLVKMRPNSYYLDKSTGKTHHGPTRSHPGSPPFRITKERWAREQKIGLSESMFIPVKEAEAE